jgi:adenylate cyclase class 2
MMPSTTLEREIKLAFPSVEDARLAILATGATPLLGRRLQEDALLDNDEEELRRRRCVLRVRTENGKSRLTFKGPVQPGLMKVLEELGLHVWFRYEKYREEFAHEDVIVAIDETPVGVFVEIEGGEQGIAAMAEALGRTPDDYILDSYRGLYLRYREEHRLSGPDMVFPEPDGGL